MNCFSEIGNSLNEIETTDEHTSVKFVEKVLIISNQYATIFHIVSVLSFSFQI